MSKAMLILDEMPKSCIKCKLGLMYGSYCAIDGDTYVTEGNKSSDCPLKPLPQKNKYDVEKYATVDYENGITLGHFLNHGWNECIDEILKEVEE